MANSESGSVSITHRFGWRFLERKALAQEPTSGTTTQWRLSDELMLVRVDDDTWRLERLQRLVG